MQKIKIGKLLKRIKESIVLEDGISYKRVTIRSKNQGISLRDIELGINIGTKRQFLIHDGQFLLSKIDARNGAFGIVSEEVDGAIITGNFWTFEVNKELLNIEWFNIFVSSSYFIDICSKASSGTTNRQYLDEKKFLDFEINLPNLNEQESFIQWYKSINNKFEQVSTELLAQQTNTQKLKTSILQDAIQGKLVLQDESDEPASLLLEKINKEKELLIKEKKIKKEKTLSQITDAEKPFYLPNGWEWVRLGDISKYIQRGKSPKYVDKSNVPVISQKCIQWSGFDIQKVRFINEDTLKSYQEERFIQYNDLLWNSTGLGTLGRINIFDIKEHSYKKIVADSHVTVIRVLKKIINVKYLYYWFAGPLVQNEINDKSTGSTKQTELGLSTIKNYILPLPPLKEQNRIVEKVEALMALCNELETNIEQSKQESEILMKAVLQEAFTIKEEVLS